MVPSRGDELGALRIAAVALVSLILLGLLLRNLSAATGVEGRVRTVGVVGVLALLFGYRIVGDRLSTRHDGLLAISVAVAIGAVMYAVSPGGRIDPELLLALCGLALFGGALVVASAVDLSTRALGGVLLFAGVAIVGAELVAFEGSRGVVLGGLIALLGALAVRNPDEFEAMEERMND